MINRLCKGCSEQSWRDGWCKSCFLMKFRSLYTELPCDACGTVVVRLKQRKPGQRVACSTRCREWCRSGSFPHYAGKWSISDTMRQQIYERDGWTCQLCFTPTSRVYSHDDPLSPSLDHIVPNSKGGTHVPENLRLAHSICNSRRGDRANVNLLPPPKLKEVA